MIINRKDGSAQLLNIVYGCLSHEEDWESTAWIDRGNKELLG